MEVGGTSLLIPFAGNSFFGVVVDVVRRRGSSIYCWFDDQVLVNVNVFTNGTE